MSTWMVVEDEPNIYDLLITMFQMWGIDGKAFNDGEPAQAWIEDVDAGRYRGELPELAVLDIRLPGSISGPMVGERLRRSPFLRDIAVVLITAYTLGRDEEIAIIQRADADRLIYKPLPGFADFRTILETTLSERRARKGAPNPLPPADRVIRASAGTLAGVSRGLARPVVTTNRPRPIIGQAPRPLSQPPAADETHPTPPGLPVRPDRPDDETH
ncbi:MAG: response regulator [Candidatus Flexifilum sp.]